VKTFLLVIVLFSIQLSILYCETSVIGESNEESGYSDSIFLEKFPILPNEIDVTDKCIWTRLNSETIYTKKKVNGWDEYSITSDDNLGVYTIGDFLTKRGTYRFLALYKAENIEPNTDEGIHYPHCLIALLEGKTATIDSEVYKANNDDEEISNSYGWVPIVRTITTYGNKTYVIPRFGFQNCKGKLSLRCIRVYYTSNDK